MKWDIHNVYLFVKVKVGNLCSLETKEKKLIVMECGVYLILKMEKEICNGICHTKVYDCIHFSLNKNSRNGKKGTQYSVFKFTTMKQDVVGKLEQK